MINGITIERVLCWEFDNTLIHGSSTIILREAEVPSKQGQQYLEALQSTKIQKALELRNPKEISRTMKRALENGVGIAIVTYAAYPEIIKPIIAKLTKFAGGLTEADLDKIFICWIDPRKKTTLGNLRGKTDHLLAVMKHFNITEKKNIMLIDSNQSNCLICQGMITHRDRRIDPEALGFQAINVSLHAQNNIDYIDLINEFIGPWTPADEDQDLNETIEYINKKMINLHFKISRSKFPEDNGRGNLEAFSLIDLDLKNIIYQPEESYTRKKQAVIDNLFRVKTSKANTRDIQRIAAQVVMELNDWPTQHPISTSRKIFRY